MIVLNSSGNSLFKARTVCRQEWETNQSKSRSSAEPSISGNSGATGLRHAASRSSPHSYLRKSLRALAYRLRSETNSFLRLLAPRRRPMIFAPRGLMILESKVSKSVRYRVRAMT